MRECRDNPVSVQHPTSAILASCSALHGWKVAEVGLELCCDQFDGFWDCFEGYHEIEKEGEGEVVLAEATNSRYT
jgi:hypothetical protein